jgi:hypothetical protein
VNEGYSELTRQAYQWVIGQALAGQDVLMPMVNERYAAEWAARFSSSDLTPDPVNPYKFSFKLGGSIELRIIGGYDETPQDT